MRRALSLLCVLGFATNVAQAQPLAASPAAQALRITPPGLAAPDASGLFAKQVFGGMAGFGIGVLGGAAVATLFIDNDNRGGFEGIGEVLIGAILGGVVGSSVMVYRIGNAEGNKSSYLLTLAGSFVGVVGGPAIFVTVPLGGAFGYNAVRKPK